MMKRVCMAVLVSAAATNAQTCRTLVRFDTTFGPVEVSLLDSDAPLTVANFIRYVDTGRYDWSFSHRLIQNFVLQGGGFRWRDSTGLSTVTAYAPIPNEFSPAHGNVEGTIAMAKLGGNPNSATSQFFFNLKNNPDLNTQNGGFTVFGEVTSGWSVVQQLETLNTMNFNSTPGSMGLLGEVPVTGASFPISEAVLVYFQVRVVERCCYANCDGSTGAAVLTANDFHCFLNRVAEGSAYANCDGSTGIPAVTSNDFQCFLNAFAAGCT